MTVTERIATDQEVAVHQHAMNAAEWSNLELAAGSSVFRQLFPIANPKIN